MELPVEQIKISKAVRLSAQLVGYGNRSTFYEWMRVLRIKPSGGVITKAEFAELCTFGKAMAAIGQKRAAVRAMLRAKDLFTEAEFFEFAFDPRTTFTQIGELKHAS
jgi:hypothetical protein